MSLSVHPDGYPDEPLLDVEVPLRYLPESAVIDMLTRRYTSIDTRRPSKTHRYALASHVPSSPTANWGGRICDFIAIDCQKNMGPVEDRNPIHGFEIKASRADWLTELRAPDKAEAFKPYMDHWWLVVTDPRIVRDGELPEDWGLLVVVGDRLRQIKAAPKLRSQPMPKPMVAALGRAIAKTARKRVTG
jgi:hypothetical protein